MILMCTISLQQMFFGMGGGGRSRNHGPKRGKDAVFQLSVTLEELYKGTTRRLAINKTILCPKCKGKGTKAANIDPEKCRPCSGSGIITKTQSLGPGFIQRFQTHCDTCGGQGEVISAKDKCRNCEGKKTVQDKKILEVHIDKGMEDGHRIPFSGEGDQSPGIDEPGDIIVILDEKEHETFKRMSKNDLLLHMELTLTESLCGFQKVIKTLDDRSLVLTAIPGEVIKHGDVKCILGEGMPTYKNPFEKGKLVIQFFVKFPDRIDPASVLLLEKVLPPRPVVDIPIDDDLVEEVTLVDVDLTKNSGRRAAGASGRHRQAYEEDDDDDGSGLHHGHHMGGEGVQCATH